MDHRSYGIALVYMDVEKNAIITIGGAAWDNKAEWERQWNAIPEAAESDEVLPLAEKYISDEGALEDKPITKECAAILMQRPFEELLSAGRQVHQCNACMKGTS
jgi:hypothetical protein